MLSGTRVDGVDLVYYSDVSKRQRAGVGELARCTRTAQGDGGGGVEDGVGGSGEDYCWQHIPRHIPREVTRHWRQAVYLYGFGVYTQPL